MPRNNLVLKLVLALLLFCNACSNKPENTSIHFQILEESLLAASQKTSSENEMILATLNEKLADPVTHYKAAIWQPKAAQIHKLSAETAQYIEGLKKELMKREGQNKTTAFLNEAETNSLFEHIESFRRNALAVDTLLHQEFSTMAVLPRNLDSTQATKQNFYETYFANSRDETQALLSALLSNIKIAENRMLRFCKEQCPNNAFIIEDYSSFSAIVGQSSSYVRAGEKIVITAGVGAFSRKPQAHITVNGKDIPVNESGVAAYMFKAAPNAGKHSVPVQIEYTDQDGKLQVIRKDVEYTVAKE